MKNTIALFLLAGGLWTSQAAVPHLVRFSATAKGSPGVPVAIRFSLYADEEGGAPLWSETQTVETTTSGRYSVLLGASSGEGLPAKWFTSGQARWLGIAEDGQAEEPRILLASVPYALQAGDAATLGGLPVSAFALSAPAMPAGRTKAAEARDVSPEISCTAVTSDGTATSNQVARFTAFCTVEPTPIFESGGDVGIGTATPAAALDVKGTVSIRNTLSMNAKGAATASAGANSNPLDLLAASFASTTDTPISLHFRWQAEPAGNDTASPAGTLNLLYAAGSGAPAETGFAVTGQGLMTFAAGQVFPSAGTLTGVTAGSGLSGGGNTGAVTVGLTHACAGGQVLQWNGSKWACAAVGAGTITGVASGAGLSGGGSSGNITLANTGVLAVAAGTGIASSGGTAPAVNLNTGFTDGRYLKLAGGALGGTLSLAANSLAVSGNQLVQAGGNVGIGTAAPGAPLEAAGSVKISGAGSILTFPDGTAQTTAAQPAAIVNPMQVALLKWFPAYQSAPSFNVGSLPESVAFDGANIWVANNSEPGTVTKLQAATGAVLGTYTVGNGPEGVAFDGANIWVANAESNTVTKLSASNGAVAGTYNVGAYPIGIAFDGANIWVTNSTGGTVTKLVAVTGAVAGTFNIGPQPQAIAFDGTNIWVVTPGNSSVTKLLASTGQAVGTYGIGDSAGLGIVFDGTNIWVTNYWANTVTKLLASTGALVGTYNAGDGPAGIAFDGTNIWVADNNNNTVTKLLAATGALLGTYTAGSVPFGIAFDGANIWVTNARGNSVSKL